MTADERPLRAVAGDLGLSGLRLVTLCGATGSNFDAVMDSQTILDDGFARSGMTVHPVDLGSWSLPMVPRILRQIAAHKPDVILMQYPSWAFGKSIGPLAVPVLQRIAPLVIMLHEFVAANLLRKLAIGALLVRANFVGITADREKDRLCHWYPWLRGRLRHIPIASNIPPRPWAPAQPARVAYFGQLRPAKGLEEFFACHARIRQQMPKVTFEIIGAPVPQFASYGQAIQQRAQACGIQLVIGAGSNQVADELSQATIALLPFPDGASFRRGSLFASANCGVPLATLVGDDTPQELLQLLDNAHDIETLTALTLRLLSSKMELQMAHERSMELAESFGWNKTMIRYMEVFAEAVGKKVDGVGRFSKRNGNCAPSDPVLGCKATHRTGV